MSSTFPMTTVSPLWILSIFLWNTLPLVFSPNGSQVNWNLPYGVENVVFWIPHQEPSKIPFHVIMLKIMESPNYGIIHASSCDSKFPLLSICSGYIDNYKYSVFRLCDVLPSHYIQKFTHFHPWQASRFSSCK